MHYIWMFLIGFVVGLVARAIVPGNQHLGFFLTGILGIAGSFVANYAGQALGWYKMGDTAGFIASVVGAIVLLLVYGLVTKPSSGANGS